MMDIKEDQLLWFISFFDKQSASLTDKSVSGSGVNILLESDKQLVKELRKPIIRKFKKEKFFLDLKMIFGVLIQLICN